MNCRPCLDTLRATRAAATAAADAQLRDDDPEQAALPDNADGVQYNAGQPAAQPQVGAANANARMATDHLDDSPISAREAELLNDFNDGLKEIKFEASLEVPAVLKGLTDIEEQMISLVKPCMQVRYTKGRQLSFQDHVVNFFQNIGGMAQQLPRLPEDLDIIIIRAHSVQNLDQHIDFIVRRQKILDALRWKKANDPAYANVQIDQAALAQLPQSGSVAHRIPTLEQRENPGAGAAEPQGPNDAAANGEDDDDDGRQVTAGVPSIGGNQQTEVNAIRERLANLVGHTPPQPGVPEAQGAAPAAAPGSQPRPSQEVPAPAPGSQPAPGNRRHYEQVIINAPTVEPAPISEFTPGYITGAFPTLFPDGKGDFHQPRLRKFDLGDYFGHLLQFRGGRFASHRCFPWFAFNTLQRARTLSKSRIFVRQNHDEAGLTAADIKEMLGEGDERIVHKMMRYGESLRGTRAFWSARRNELTDAMALKKAPHIFFTLSAADLQWPDLHEHMPKGEGDPDPEDEDAARRKRRENLNRNPHIAAAYLDERVKLFFETVLKPLFDVEDFWYRYEWQERGSGHIHGFLWLKNAPDVDQIRWDFLKNPDPDFVIPEEQQQKMNEFKAYWDRFITAMNPFPRADENTPLPRPHPCSIPRDDLRNTNEELANLLNWIERHNRCTPSYCQIKRKVAGQASTIQCPSVRSPASHSTASAVFAFLAWRANVDFKPVLSKEAAIQYAAKYATKAEKQSPAFPELLAGVVNDADGALPAQRACQKLLNKMIGERAYSAQEVSHLMLGIPLVRMSWTVQSVSIGPEGGFREVQVADEGQPDISAEDAVTGQSWLQRYMGRAENLENLSLHDMMTGYAWRKSEWRKRREKKEVILRVFPRYSPNPESPQYENYCRTKVVLHHPFRQLSDLRTDENQPWAQVFARCRVEGHVHPKDTLRCWEHENRELEEEEDDEDEELQRDLEDLPQADWQAWAALRPNGEVPAFTFDDLGRRPLDDGWDLDESRNRWDNVDKMRKYVDEEKRVEQVVEERGHMDITKLSPEQRVIFDQFMGIYEQILDGTEPGQILLNIDGTAGCGKSFLIDSVCQEIRALAQTRGQPDPVRVLAPSGVAALNIGGKTIHSGLHIPVNDFAKLSGGALGSLQVDWAGVHFLIIDEKSMVGLKLLSMIDTRCRELRPLQADTFFGGLHVALVGDFAQLPPVGDTALYAPPLTALTDSAARGREGHIAYRQFTQSHLLRVVHRQNGNAPEQVAFRGLLLRASEGTLTRADWATLLTRSQVNLSQEAQEAFKDAICLFATKASVEEVNLGQLSALNFPVARILAQHEGGAAAKAASSDDAGGLEPHVLLSRHAKVMISRNIWTDQGTVTAQILLPNVLIVSGLVNGTLGVVEDIIWAPGSERSDLPIAVLISCKTYKGPTLWRTEPRPGFETGIPIVPIIPFKTSYQIGTTQCSRTQIPLRLAWAVTIHKSQGLTLDKIKLGLGKKEFSTGLTFVGLSRVKALTDIMIVDNLDFSRIERLGGRNLQHRQDDFVRRYA
ncbi:hypothetical protein D9611_013064 [Ephemerocybe angulata]|uniref:ATP-dependent DNA helicase n=1 Tax=Ephemerocybe angulata TaxID=980116 RepID=A0A8H5BX86_9AGAR|nr:hypothetical protein D9611_013064 [Tulosesus angulatus]